MEYLHINFAMLSGQRCTLRIFQDKHTKIQMQFILFKQLLYINVHCRVYIRLLYEINTLIHFSR